MEFVYTYAVSVAFTLYFGFTLISAVDNAADTSLRNWLRRSRMLLLGVACALLGGLLGYMSFMSSDAYERWSVALGLAAACGAFSTLIGTWARRRLEGDADD